LFSVWGSYVGNILFDFLTGESYRFWQHVAKNLLWETVCECRSFVLLFDEGLFGRNVIWRGEKTVGVRFF